MPFFDSGGPRQGELLPTPSGGGGASGGNARPPAPFAGSMPRLFAFLIDGIVLYAAAALPMRSAREGLLTLNPLLPYLGFVIGFLYFLLATGPLGNGRTIGMLILGLRIVDRDGRPVGWGPALRRSAVQFGAVFGILNVRFLDPNYCLLIWPAEMRYAGLLTFTLAGMVCLTLALALLLTIGMHPHKRGWHDLLAGTYVTRHPLPETFLETLRTPPDPITERRLAMHLKMTVPFWLVSMIVLAVGPLKQLTRGDIRVQIEHAAAISAETAGKAGLSAMMVIYPSTEGREQFEQAVLQRRRHAETVAVSPPIDGHLPTTETLRAQFFMDGETIMVLTYQRNGAFEKARMDSVDFRQTMDDLHGQAWSLWEDYREAWKRHSDEPLPEARRFIALIVEQAQILFLNDARVVLKVEGPADPAAGGLEYVFDPVSAMRARMAAAENATTTATRTGQ